MTTSSIANATLGDLIAFNAQVESLAQAGLLPKASRFSNAEAARVANYRFASQVALKTGQGRSFTDAFQDTTNVPVSYRLAFVSWVCADRSPKSFDLLKGYEPRSSGVFFQRFVWLQLRILGILAFCVMALWVWNAVPSLIDMYVQSRVPLGWGASVLQSLHHSRIYWTIGIPALAAGVFAWHRIAATQPQFEATEKLQATQNESLKYDFLSILTSAGHTAEQAVRVYQEVAGVSSIVDGNVSSSSSLAVSRWAAHERNEVTLDWKNSVRAYGLFAVIAGAVVFGVAISLFGPMIELFSHMCEQGGK